MSSQDLRLTALAEQQHGLVTFTDARLAGLGVSQIQRRVTSGRWVRVARRVYRMAGVPPTWEQLALAACLAAPDGATISHLTGAAIHRWRQLPPPRPQVTVSVDRSHGHPFAEVHRARLGPAEVVIRNGLPVTTPSRTLIDCAALLGPTRLQRLVDDAFHQGSVTEASIQHAWDLARLGPGRHGEVMLRAAIEHWATAIRPGSPAELRLRSLVIQWGYPEPALQVPITDQHGTIIARADAGWPDRRIGLEYDGERFHGPGQWSADNDRQAAIEGLGWTLLRADRTDLLPGERSLRDALARAWA